MENEKWSGALEGTLLQKKPNETFAWAEEKSSERTEKHEGRKSEKTKSRW
jgi:hypothetical protein